MQKLTSPLTAERIAAHCVTLNPSLVIEVVPEITSTNAELIARTSSLTNPTLLVAEAQTAGRGRAGRSWLSSLGSSLTFSLAWPCLCPAPQSLMGLPLAVGVALAEALSSMDVKVQLKWPNDVLRNGKKLAGVLIETRESWAVIGVGLNLLLPDELEHQIDYPVANAIWLAQMDRNQMLGTIIKHLVSCLQQFCESGFSVFASSWNALHAYAGQQVRVIDRGEVIRQGIARGVDETGCLLVEDQNKVLWPILAGDVSLRLL